MAEEINRNLREHESSVGDWYLKNAVKYLYRFFDLFNAQWFSGRLPQAVIAFKKTRVTSLGHYRFGRNEFGLKHEINMNSQYMERPFCQIVATLLHEMIHLEEDLLGMTPKKSSGNHHSKFFRDRAGLLGIPSDAKGYSLGMGEPFTGFIQAHGVRIIEEKKGERKFKKGKSNLKKYSCGCTNVRVGKKEFSALCRLCGKEFVLVEDL
ncbi:MAG: SprT-like domain-containing protein [archaeon]